MKKILEKKNLFKKLQRNFSKVNKAVLPDLSYSYNSLEPVLSGKLMEFHHGKHHQAYVNNYNISVEKFLDAQAKGNVKEATELTNLIKFNGGGHYNHSFFWEA